jgi:hypothetical protein
MGLDWIIDTKPKDGFEKEYMKIILEKKKAFETNTIIDMYSLREMKRRLNEISVRPNKYIEDEMENSQYDSKSEAENNTEANTETQTDCEKRERRISYMTQFLMPIEFKNSKINNWKNAYDPLCIRGKAISRSIILSDDLCNEAYLNHTANESLEYADRIEECLNRYESTHITLSQMISSEIFTKEYDMDIREYIDNIPDPIIKQLTTLGLEKLGVNNINEVYYDLLTCKIAINWLRYWGIRGFGYIACY